MLTKIKINFKARALYYDKVCQDDCSYVVSLFIDNQTEPIAETTLRIRDVIFGSFLQ